MNLQTIQTKRQEADLDGWIFLDHHERDPLAYRVLGLSPPGRVSRRWYYSIPASGEPRGLIHRVEPQALNALPGTKIPCSRWQEPETGWQQLPQGVKQVAMPYSLRCAVPYAANADAHPEQL